MDTQHLFSAQTRSIYPEGHVTCCSPFLTKMQFHSCNIIHTVQHAGCFSSLLNRSGYLSLLNTRNANSCESLVTTSLLQAPTPKGRKLAQQQHSSCYCAAYCVFQPHTEQGAGAGGHGLHLLGDDHAGTQPRPPVPHVSLSVFLSSLLGNQAAPRTEGGKMAAILQLSQYCTFRMDSISTVITEPGQPVSHQVGQQHPFGAGAGLPPKAALLAGDGRSRSPASGEAETSKGPGEFP